MAVNDTVGITFINGIMGRGVLNNVVNIQLGACLFDPTPDGSQIDPSLTPVCRLRMDLMCAKQLHEMLGELLQSIGNEPTPEASAEGRPN